jgi:hypothetical protein
MVKTARRLREQDDGLGMLRLWAFFGGWFA